MKKVFISYSHKQRDWVHGDLLAVLRAAGAEVLIDDSRFQAGIRLTSQIASAQAKADVHVLVLSPDYLISKFCRLEMEYAISQDPEFEKGIIIPIKVAPVVLPPEITQTNPLCIDFNTVDSSPAWRLLQTATGTSLGADPFQWLKARNEIRAYLERGQSVNFVVDEGVAWRQLIEDLKSSSFDDLAVVSLESGATASRRGLIEEVLNAYGFSSVVEDEPRDLVALNRLCESGAVRYLALTHFDLSQHRRSYDLDFFAALRHLIMGDRVRLVLLVVSRTGFESSMPPNHPLSHIELRTVFLQKNV